MTVCCRLTFPQTLSMMGCHAWKARRVLWDFTTPLLVDDLHCNRLRSKSYPRSLLCKRRYNSNKAHQHEVDDMMETMEETLYQYGVDAVFAGHVHAYESSYPVFRFTSNLCI